MSAFHRLWPRSLGGQLAASFALSSLLLGLALSIVLGAQSAARIREDEGQALASIARVAGLQLAEGLQLREREVQAMAASPTLWVDGLNGERVRQAFARSQAVNPHSAWLGVIDDQGRVVLATGHLLEGHDVGQRPWYIAGRRGSFVGDVHPAVLLANLLPRGSDGGPQRFVDFAAPIVRDGELLGVVGMHGSWDWARKTIESLAPVRALDRGLELYIFDRDQRLIYTPSVRPQDPADVPQRLPDVPGGTGVVTWQDGVDALTAVVPVPALSTASDLGWTVVAREPVSLAFAPARNAALLALAIGAVAALTAAAIGAWLARRLTGPLEQLARTAHTIQATPGVASMTPLSGAREIVTLSTALAAMTQRLQQSNAELEARVLHRTEALERANAVLERLAHHDPLTGLLNRRGFDERMKMLVASARRRQSPVSLIVIDADHFKRVNDEHGHDIGDDVLRALGDTLRRRLREVDVVARLGGEEFVVALPDTGLDAAAGVAGDLVKRVAELPIAVVGHVTVSCGVAGLRVGAEQPREAIARADGALYLAKRQGRNRHCVASPDGDVVQAPEAEDQKVPA